MTIKVLEVGHGGLLVGGCALAFLDVHPGCAWWRDADGRTLRCVAVATA